MDDLDARRALDVTQGDTPSPEFVASLRHTLEVELDAQSEPTRTGPAPTAIDVSVLDEGNRPMNRNRLTMLLAAAAAIVLVIVGLVVVTNDDDDDPGTDVADDNVENDPLPADPPGTAETTTSSSTTTTEPPLSNWDFEITYIDIEDDALFLDEFGCCGGVAANDEFAWVKNGSLDGLHVIELATNRVVGSTPVPFPPGQVWNAHGFDSLWVGFFDNSLRRIDPETGEILATLDVGSNGWIETGPDSVWIAAGREAVRVDPTTNTIAARIPLDTETQEDVGGFIDENADGVWMRDGVGRVHRIDPATNSVVATFETPTWNEFSGGYITAGEEGVWATGGPSGSMYRIDPATNTVSAEVLVELDGKRVSTVWGPEVGGGSVWVRYKCADSSCNGIARIDPDTNEVVSTVEMRDGWVDASEGASRGIWHATDRSAFSSGPRAVARIDF